MLEIKNITEHWRICDSVQWACMFLWMFKWFSDPSVININKWTFNRTQLFALLLTSWKRKVIWLWHRKKTIVSYNCVLLSANPLCPFVWKSCTKPRAKWRVLFVRFCVSFHADLGFRMSIPPWVNLISWVIKCRSQRVLYTLNGT